MKPPDGRGGSIVNVTSLGAHQGFPQNPSYQASKAALRQLTRAMALDFGDFGVRVNSLCPGYIETAMTSTSHDDAGARAARAERTILGRWGRPDDLVGPCRFLLSDASSYVTGIDLPVDGGWLAKGL
jgi:2-deoxy-D-gluconate 3-dehydrogenase